MGLVSPKRKAELLSHFVTQASVEPEHKKLFITYIDLRCEFGPDGVEVLRVPDGREGARSAVLRGAEHELGPAEVVVHVVGQGHLRVSERVEHLLVLCIHRSFRTILKI